MLWRQRRGRDKMTCEFCKILYTSTFAVLILRVQQTHASCKTHLSLVLSPPLTYSFNACKPSPTSYRKLPLFVICSKLPVCNAMMWHIFLQADKNKLPVKFWENCQVVCIRWKLLCKSFQDCGFIPFYATLTPTVMILFIFVTASILEQCSSLLLFWVWIS